MLVEAYQTGDSLDYVRLFVHHDYRGRAERALHSDEIVEVHQDGVARAKKKKHFSTVTFGTKSNRRTRISLSTSWE